VDEPGSVIATGDYACNTTQIYQSVICFGRAAAVEDTAEKERIIRLLMQKYVDEPTPERMYNPELLKLDRTMVVAMDIEIMTGKHREPPHHGASYLFDLTGNYDIAFTVSALTIAASAVAVWIAGLHRVRWGRLS
jgi:hypothetical protein